MTSADNKQSQKEFRDGGKKCHTTSSSADAHMLEWNSLCLTLPTAPVVDLAVHERDGALVAATHGLSIFLLEIDTIRAASGQ